MKKTTFKTIKMTASLILLLCATFKADAQNFTTGSQVGGTGDGHYLITTKDFNGDGYDDIASNDGNNNFRIALSNGSGGFNAPVTIGSGLWAYAADDLDNDGDIDIVASSSQYNTPGFYIYKNNGSGSFTLQSSTPTNITFSNYIVGAQVSDLVIFDANGDGKKDIVLVPYLYSSNNSFDARTKNFLFLNTTSGSTVSFSQNAIITTNQLSAHGMAADIDKDGDIDLILDGTSSNTTEVFKNNGSGSFTFSGYAPGYSGGQFFYDWNNDGYLDIMTMDDYNGYGLRYKLNDGAGNFAAGVQLLATGNNSISNGTGFLADMNGDGLVDAVYRGTNVNGNRGYINIHTNTGCGFSATPTITSTQLTNDATINVTKIDANHDGKPDVFVIGGGTNKTFLNNIATATPPLVSTITGVTNASRCGDGNVMLKAGASNSGNISWWDAASGGSQITTGNNLTVNVNSSNPIQSYWVDANLNGCTSSRVKVVGIYKGEATSSNTTINICPAQLPYSWNGLTFNTAGTQTKTGLTNNSGCDSSATLTVNVSTPVTPSVTISTANANVCDNANATFTATATNGGSLPVYEWYKNGVNAGTGSSITFLAGTLNTNDAIGCVLTANNACQTTAIAGSNKIYIIIKTSPQIGVSTALGTVCTIGATKAVYNTNTSGGGVWISSNTNVATVTTSNGASGLVTIVDNGTATISYVKTDAATGCKAVASSILVADAVAAPTAITGTSNLCVGAAATFSSSPSGGVWSSDNNRATINASTGVATGSNAGTATLKYTLTNASNCSTSASYNVAVTAKPSVPTIAYAAGTTNPQYGAPTGSWCTNRNFTVVGSPVGGVWSSTGVLTVNATTGAVNTGNISGAASLTYTAGSAGCTNSRTIIASIVGCGSRNSQPSTVDSRPLTVDFTIYPNPAHSFISLKVDRLIGAGSIVITDLYGKQVKMQPLSLGTNNVNISNLSKGFYLISTITTEGKTTKKLVVE